MPIYHKLGEIPKKDTLFLKAKMEIIIMNNYLEQKGLLEWILFYTIRIGQPKLKKY